MKYDEKYYIFLDNLRESGLVNMFGAAPYLREAFPELDKKTSRNVLVDWMKTFSERKIKSQATKT